MNTTRVAGTAALAVAVGILLAASGARAEGWFSGYRLAGEFSPRAVLTFFGADGHGQESKQALALGVVGSAGHEVGRHVEIGFGARISATADPFKSDPYDPEEGYLGTVVSGGFHVRFLAPLPGRRGHELALALEAGPAVAVLDTADNEGDWTPVALGLGAEAMVQYHLPLRTDRSMWLSVEAGLRHERMPLVNGAGSETDYFEGAHVLTGAIPIRVGFGRHL